MSDEIAHQIVEIFKKKLFEYEQFLAGILVFFEKHPDLNKKPFPIVHSFKSRIKDFDHLHEKVIRKIKEGKDINADNFHREITDLIGVRILHLYQDQFATIHKAIIDKIDAGDWTFYEAPKAFTWDPESRIYFEGIGIMTEIRDTYYTSIHYLIKPNNTNIVCCEIQVRTLFEEIWGEIDHTINYPKPTKIIACKEQLRVLSKLVSTGTRLADSIFRTYNDLNVKENGS